MILRNFKMSKKCKKKITTNVDDPNASTAEERVVLRSLHSNKKSDNKTTKSQTAKQGSERSNSIIFPLLSPTLTLQVCSLNSRQSSSLRRSDIHSVDQSFEINYMKCSKERGFIDGLVKSRSTEDNSQLGNTRLDPQPMLQSNTSALFPNPNTRDLPVIKGVSERFEEKERLLRVKRESLMLSRKTMVDNNEDFSVVDDIIQDTNQILQNLTSSAENILDRDDVFLESLETNEPKELNNIEEYFRRSEQISTLTKNSDEYRGANRSNLFLDFVNRFSTSTSSTSSTPSTPNHPLSGNRNGQSARYSESISQSPSSKKNLFRRSMSENSSMGVKTQLQSQSTTKKLVRNKSDKRSEESLFKGILRKSRKKTQRSHSDGSDRDSRTWHLLPQATTGGRSAPASPQTKQQLKLIMGATVDHEKGLHESFSDVTRDEEFRKEKSLTIRIQEAKGIQDGKRYYCVLLVNGKVKNKTSTKLKDGICFWGEEFEVFEYQEVEKIGIRLNREDKKLIGCGEFNPVATIQNPKLDEWIKVSSYKKDKEDVAVRIRYTFRSITILPLAEYKSFIRYLSQSSLTLCKGLEASLNAKTKEDFLTSLISILHCNSKATSFMGQLIKKDVEQNGNNDKVMFRANSMATKAIEAYMRLVGRRYLESTLLDSVVYLIETEEEFEVDPSKIESNFPKIEERQKNLLSAVTRVWTNVYQSAKNFPEEIRSVFFVVRENMKNTEMADRLISASVFLRLLCPATMSPTLFDLTKEYPQPAANRRLTLVAKTMQTLANFTTFQSKEDYMQFLNPFIEREQTNCRQFLIDISGPSPRSSETASTDPQKEIYLGRHLALLHLHLKDVIESGSCTVNDSELQLLNSQMTHINNRLLEQEKLFVQRQKENLMKVTSPMPFEFIKSTPGTSFKKSERAPFK